MKTLLRTLLIAFAFQPFALPAAAEVQTFGIIADAGSTNGHSREVRESLLMSQVTDLIMPGDNLYDPRQSYGDVWGDWYGAGFRFPVVALGNHTRTYEEEIEYFHLPGEYYSIANETVRFIVLNSDHATTASEQARWLESELVRASEPFVFLVYHHSPVTLTGRHSWREKEEFHLETRPVVLRHRSRITGTLLGHDHIATLAEMDRIPLIVSGAVFEAIPTTRVDYVEDGIAVKTRWLFRDGYYWTRLDLNSESGEAWVNFVRADRGEVSCSIRIRPQPLLLRDNCRRTGQ